MFTKLTTLFSVVSAGVIGGCGEVSDLGNQAGIVSEPAVLSFLVESLASVTPGVPYKDSIGVKGGVAPFTYELLSGALPEGFKLDPDSGFVQGTAGFNLAGKVFEFTVRATDALGGKIERAFKLSVNPYAITMFPETLPAVTPAQAYELSISVSGAQPPVAFTTSGSLPQGLILETDPATGTARIVSGKNSVRREDGNTKVNFGIVATDANGMIARRDYIIDIKQAAILDPLAISTSQMDTPAAGSRYAQAFTASGGLPPYKFVLLAGTLLPGLSLDESGVLSGAIPASAAGSSFAFTVQVQDSLGSKADKSFSGSTSRYSYDVVPNFLPDATPTRPYSARIYTVGAALPITYSVSGNFPAGLKLDVVDDVGFITDNGSGISSTLQNTTRTFRIVATDANGVTVNKDFSLIVNAAPTVDPLTFSVTSISSPLAGSSYAAILLAQGGVMPYTFAVQTGTLPSGLSLSSSGAITGTTSMAAANTAFSFTVRVTDAAGSTALQSYSGLVSNYSYSVVPDQLPPVTPQQPYSTRIYTVGAAAPVTYSLSGDFPSGLTMVVASSIATIQDSGGGVSASLQNTTRNFQIVARDANNITQTVNMSLAIGAALVTPVLTITTTSLYTPLSGDNYIASINVSGGAPPYSYAVTAGGLPSGLNLNSSTGFITGVPAFDTSGDPFVYTIRVTDSASSTAERTFSGTVDSYSMTLTPASLPNGFPEAPYSASFTAGAGNSPYSYTVFSGALPDGLSLNSVTGVISGTVAASAAGQSYNFTIQVLDSSGTIFRRAQSISVNSYTTTISAPTNPTGNEGVAFAAIMTAGGGVAPYTFEYQGTLPTGVALNNNGNFFGTPAASTGSLSGTPYIIQVRSRDSRGYPSAFATVTITVGVTAVTLSVGTPAAGVRGARYTHSISATGGRAPYTYSLAATSAQLPDGLSLSTNGAVTGTPVVTSTCPAGTPVRVIAEDALSQVSATVTLCIVIGDGVVVTSETMPPIVRSQSYSKTLTTSGGTSPYTYTGYGFPVGLSVSSSGVVSGITASSDTSATLYFTVEDSSTPNKLSGSKSFVVPIVDAVTLDAATLSNGAAGRSYSETLTASGGQAPRSFAIVSGSLPPGLTISSSGGITGTIDTTAAVNSPYNFTVEVTDSLGLKSSQVSYSIPVSVPARFKDAVLPPARQGARYVAVPTWLGGVPPFTFSFPSTFPSGLSIDSASGIISSSNVTESSGTTQFTIRLTDSRGIVTNQTHSLTVAASAAAIARPKVAAPSFSEICPTPYGTAACGSWHPFRVGKLVHSGSFQNAAFSVYFAGNALTNNPNNVIVIARMDSEGRIGSLGAVGSTTVTNATLQIPIGDFVGDIEIADMDNDGLNDIVVSSYTSNHVRILWNGGESSGMPVFSLASSNTFALPGVQVRAGALHVRRLRTQNASGLDVAVISNLDQAAPANNDTSINVFLSNCNAGSSCAGSRSTVLAAGTAFATSVNATLHGIAGATRLVSGNFFGTTNGSCPSLATAGRRRSASESWVFVLRQNGSTGNCLGTFTPAVNVYENARYLVSEASINSDLVAADFNNDSIDDIATVSDISTNVRVYLMRSNGTGWNSTYSGAAVTAADSTIPIAASGTSLNVSRITTICSSPTPPAVNDPPCSYPSLLITGGRATASVAGVTNYQGNSTPTSGYLGVVPNTNGTFDTGGLNVILYAAPPGQASPPALYPVTGASPNQLDVVMLGATSDAMRANTGAATMGVPFLMTFARNGSSTTDPFKANAANNGVTTSRRNALRSYPDEFFYNEDTGSAVIADFTGDGFADIATHLVNVGSISLNRGTGDAGTTFGQTENFPVGVQHGFPMNLSPQTMDAGDFNNDGRPDLVVVGWSSRAIGVLRTDVAAGAFVSTPDVYSSGAGDARPLAVKVVDIDGDGKLDILFSKLRFNFPSTGSNTAYLSVLRGKGNGYFFEASDIANGLGTGCASEYIRKIETVDLDGNGFPEILAMCRGTPASISVLRRHTDGTWIKNNSSAPINAPASALGMDFVVGQFNPGGACSYGKTYCVDVVMSVNLVAAVPTSTMRYYGRVTMDTPTGSGAFNVTAGTTSFVNISGQASSLAMGDFNRDGYLDIGASLISHSGGGVNAVIAVPVGTFTNTDVTGFAGLLIEGDGNGNFANQSMFGGQNAGMSNIVTGHLNNTVDSILDFVLTHRAHTIFGTIRGRLPDNAAIFNYLGEN
jgi:hypothetical protein